jgi:hypothetical protein
MNERFSNQFKNVQPRVSLSSKTQWLNKTTLREMTNRSNAKGPIDKTLCSKNNVKSNVPG